jgi:uncharacterized protein
MSRWTIDELATKMDEAVLRRLENYVYRLIDPRNGETFYVGVGRGKRVLDHVRGTLQPAPTDSLGESEDGDYEDEENLKLSRIWQIRKAGLEVGHIIHRHGIPDPKIARIVEAALIDAYPGLSNRVNGHGSSDFGCRHLEQIIHETGLPEFTPTEPLILISIGRSFEAEDSSVYENTRKAWRASRRNAESFRLILGHSGGVVRGVFRPTGWLIATRENFPDLDADMPGRIGFFGEVADPETVQRYLGHRVPDRYRARGAANPFRYVRPGHSA